MHNCALCGSSDHNQKTCPRRGQDPQDPGPCLPLSEKATVAEAHKADKRKANLLAQLKYTSVGQRSRPTLQRPLPFLRSA